MKPTCVLKSAQRSPSWTTAGSGASRPSAGGWGESPSGGRLCSPPGERTWSSRGAGSVAGLAGPAPVSRRGGAGAAAVGPTSVVAWSVASVVVRVAASTPARATTRPIVIAGAGCLPSAVRGGAPVAGAREAKVVVTVLTCRWSGRCEHHRPRSLRAGCALVDGGGDLARPPVACARSLARPSLLPGRSLDSQACNRLATGRGDGFDDERHDRRQGDASRARA
jgi:hypothetical protein